MAQSHRFSILVIALAMWHCVGLSPADACSSLTLNNGGLAVFAANYDNEIHEGMLYINTRGLLKTGWTASTTGAIAQWTSKYASVTVNEGTYQLPWAGMNEEGLCLSTMSLSQTAPPQPDERPPLEYGPFWMQYILDTCATIDDVIASDAKVRIVDTVDHYLVTDRTGESAVIELLDGEMVIHTGNDLPVSALTNSLYEDSLDTWLLYRGSGNEGCIGEGNSLERFCTVANRVAAFRPTTTEDAVAYAFETLRAVENLTPWSIVFDTRNLRAYLRTQPYAEIRFIDLLEAELQCPAPDQMLDVHEELSGDITHAFSDFDFEVVLDRFIAFINIFLPDPMSPEELRELLHHLADHTCVHLPYRRPLSRLRPGL